jgi:predicted DNA-binding transcriptional regulator AlpA
MPPTHLRNPIRPIPVTPANDRIVSEREAAQIRGVSEYTLRRQAQRGEGPERIQLSPRRIGYRYSSLLK